jgi:hypothetical protein
VETLLRTPLVTSIPDCYDKSIVTISLLTSCRAVQKMATWLVAVTPTIWLRW